jgi:hypothetical protein
MIDNDDIRNRRQYSFNRTRNRQYPTNIQMLYNLINEYNQNMQTYQDNSLSLMSSLITEMRNENISRQRTEQSQQTRMHFEFIPTTDFSNFFQNVPVAPTEEQINRASSTLVYNSDEPLQHNSCPITIENFEDGESVMILNHCGHAFREDAIRNWFSNNVRCPVCRHDIRNVSTLRNTPVNNTNNTSVNDISNNDTINSPPPSPIRRTNSDINQDLSLAHGQPLTRVNSLTTQNLQSIIEQTINAIQPLSLPNLNGHMISMDIPLQFDVSQSEVEEQL